MASDFTGLVIVVLTCLTVLVILSIVPIIRDITNIHSKVQIVVFNNDRGSAMYSFLASSDDGIGYEEILASYLASNVPEGRDKDIKELIEVQIETGLKVIKGSETLKEYGSLGSRTVRSDIALPGILKGEVVIS